MLQQLNKHAAMIEKTDKIVKIANFDLFLNLQGVYIYIIFVRVIDKGIFIHLDQRNLL